MTDLLDSPTDENPPEPVKLAIPSDAAALMRNVTPSPIDKARKEIVPPEPIKISSKMRQLMGRNPFRDPSRQVDLDQLTFVLAAELGASSVLSMRLVQRLATLAMDIDQLQQVKGTAIEEKRASAAREVVMPGYNHFIPAGPMVLQNTGHMDTAYGTFMDNGGAHYLSLEDAVVIEQAVAALAKRGLREEVLTEMAYILALPTIERLDKIQATKAAESESLVAEILRIEDRIARKGAISMEGPR